MYYAYKIVNEKNNKMYCSYCSGNPSLISWEQIKNQAKNNPVLKHLYNSLKKYGTHSFKLEVEFTSDNIIDVVNYTNELIKELRTDNSDLGYNQDYKKDYLYINADDILIPLSHKKDDNNANSTDTELSAEAKRDYDFYYTINVCHGYLKNMEEEYKSKHFVEFMEFYYLFNHMIPITGVYDNIDLSTDKFLHQLFIICKNTLASFIHDYDILD